MNLLSKLVLKFPKTLLLFLIFTAVIASYLSAKIPFDFSTESLFITNDPHRVTFLKFKKDFGNDDNFIFIAFRHPNLFSPPILKKIRKISQGLRQVRHIEESISLVDVIGAEDLMVRFQERVKQWEKQLALMGMASGEGKAFLLMASKVPLRPLIAELQRARTKAEILNKPRRLQLLKKRILANPLYLKNIISKDGTTTGIFLIASPKVTNNTERKKLLASIQAVLKKGDPQKTFQFHLAGLPVVRTEYARLISRDHLTFLPIIIIIFIFLLFLIFKDFYQTLVPLLTIGVSVLWTVGIMYLCGENINIINNVLYVLLLVIGIASSVHVINYYNTEILKCDKMEAIKNTIHHMGRACFFTCSTTAIGFLSLLVTRVQIVRSFGLFCALGVMFIFLFSSLAIPLALFFLPVPSVAKRKKKMDHLLLERALRSLARFNRNHSSGILIFTFFLFIFLGFSILNLVIDSHMMEELSDDNPIVVANRFVEKNLTGILPLEMLLVEKKKGLFFEPKEHRRIDKLQRFIATQKDIVSKVTSVIDVLKTINLVANNYNPKYNRIPKDKMVIRRLFELEEMMSKEERGVFHFTARHHSTLRISIRLMDAGSNAHFKLIEKIKAQMAKDPQFKKNYQVIFTGDPHMAAIVLRRLIGSMLASIFLAVGIIFFVMIFLFRSLKIALVSVIPNILPIIFTMGVMGVSGIILRTSTVVIFSISLGIAVDDTIHYLISYRKFLHEGLSSQEAMEQALVTTGKAMFWTSMVICCGWMVLTVSHFKATVDFGLLGSVTLGSALLGDLILLPVLLGVFSREKTDPLSDH